MANFMFNSKRLNDLRMLCSISDDVWNNVDKEIINLGENIDPSKFLKSLQKCMGEEHGTRLFQVIISLSSFARAYKEQGKDVLERFTSDLSLQKEWYEENSEKWQKVKAFLEKFLNQPTVILVTKTIDISSNYGSVVSDLSITTDIRPVFDTDHDKMVGSIVTSGLLLETTSAEASHKEVFVLHIDDLKKLKREVDKAIKKIETVKSSMSSVIGDNYYVPGEESDGN